MNSDEKWVVNPEVVLREESDDWALLFDAATGQVVGVNPVGAAIWRLMDGNHSLEEIASKLQAEFSGTPENLKNEIQAFFDSLVERGFIGKATS